MLIFCCKLFIDIFLLRVLKFEVEGSKEQTLIPSFLIAA